MNKFLILLVLFAVGCSDDVGLSQSEKEYNKGIDFYEKNDYQTATSCFSEAIRLDPKDALAYGNRGLAYGHLGKRLESFMVVSPSAPTDDES
jgi:tetratricopeptide (TPR) repeat protein